VLCMPYICLCTPSSFRCCSVGPSIEQKHVVQSVQDIECDLVTVSCSTHNHSSRRMPPQDGECEAVSQLQDHAAMNA
jgi:hypothetical protein